MPAADESRTGPVPGAVPQTSTNVPRQRVDPDAGPDAGRDTDPDAGPDVESGLDAAPADSPTDLDAISTTATPTGPAPAASASLTEREQRILDFERQWWKHAGAKEQSIRDTFGLSATRYYQLLHQLLDNPAALAAEPVLVARLRRLRAARSRARRR
ncbi:DUF3263 domain-containing protein [Solwaraspora sp. WMMD791]|uniref:DUF3263 domain-containing protein n=1 Tax=Solwaraspora sp. WMMD791 TaxID=3016086 RepID=UPI00249CE51A|nr:DUF3263 domain-containing protein [Solwaraspora sp. WMMD791]WFE26380.1 DUF3263 domain-containing protein [Solwaraspora sp. WMMD791]